MGTEKSVGAPDVETLERIDAFLKDSGDLPRRQRPQRQLEQAQEPESDDQEIDEELDPIYVMLKKERLARNWTQWDVARRMGYTNASNVSRYEAGLVDLPTSTLRAWAAVLDVNILARAIVKRGRPRVNFRKN